jgi:hypothetical protein
VNRYLRLVAEAEMRDWRVAVFIEPSASPKSQRSRLSRLALLNREGLMVAHVSLLHDDRLDLAAEQLLPVVLERRIV